MWMARRAPKKLDAINVGCALLFFVLRFALFFLDDIFIQPPDALVFLFCFLHTSLTRKGFFVSRPISDHFLHSFFLKRDFFFSFERAFFFSSSFYVRLLLVFANNKYNGFGKGSVDVFG